MRFTIMITYKPISDEKLNKLKETLEYLSSFDVHLETHYELIAKIEELQNKINLTKE